MNHFTVDTFLDTPDANVGDGLALDLTGHTSLRAAIMEANALSDPTTIQLGSGNYALTINGANENSAATGDLDIFGPGPITIVGTRFGTSRILGVVNDRLFEVAPGGNLDLSLVRLSNGQANLGDAGGGILVNGGQLFLHDSLLEQNVADRGGAIAVLSGAATLTNVTVRANRATQEGGGLFLRNGSANLIQDTFEQNSAGVANGEGLGGGIAVQNGLPTPSVLAFNTIVAQSQNTGGGSGIAADIRGPISGTANLIGIGDGQAGTLGYGTLHDGIRGNFVGTAQTPVDPQVTFGDFGGPFLSYRPNATSLAVDHGSNFAFGIAAQIPDRDQRGAFYQAANQQRDIGAVESGFQGFIVNTLADTPDANPGDGLAADANGQVSLRAAIQEANAVRGRQFIVLPPAESATGIYLLTRTGPHEDFAATGDLDITDDLDIDGYGAGQTIIDGNQSDRVFEIAGGTMVNLDRMTIRNGSATQGDAGGGIYSAGLLTLSDVELTANISTDKGGGLAVSPTGSVTVFDTDISGNSAQSGSGIFNDVNGHVLVQRSRLQQNSASNGGAALFNSGTAMIERSEIVGNSQFSQGGGIGGALANFGQAGNSPTLSVTTTTVEGNTGNSPAGGLHNQGGQVTITQSSFLNNNGQNAGGAFNESGTMVIENSTFSGNSGQFAGAMLNAGTLQVRSSTVSENQSSSSSGGLSNVTSGTLTIQNTIVSGNLNVSVQSGSTPLDVDGSFSSGGHNLIGAVGSATGFVTSDLMGVDPQLSALGDFSFDAFHSASGGSSASQSPPTFPPLLMIPSPKGYLPLSGSPVIDAADGSNGPTVDQYGRPRPSFGGAANAPDIGAVEQSFATLHGHVFDDLNGNGLRDNGEPDVAETSLRLFESVLQPGATTFSQADGKFEFTMLPQPTDVHLQVTPPPGFVSPRGPLGFAPAGVMKFGETFLPNAIAASNQDGLPSIMVGGSKTTDGSAAITVLPLGRGSLSEPPNILNFPNVSKILAVAVGDFDNDGKLDGVATTFNGQALLLQQGAPESVPITTTVTGLGAEPNLVVTGDFNGDGHLDFAVADHATGTVHLEFTDGAFHITQEQLFPRTGVISAMLVGPRGELMLANSQQGTVSLIHQKANVGLVEDTLLSGLVGVNGLAVRDLNGDGRADLVATDSQGVSLFLDVQASPPSLSSQLSLSGAAGVLVADFDHDAIPDLAVTNTVGTVLLYRGRGDGRFDLSATQPLSVNPAAFSAISLLPTATATRSPITTTQSITTTTTQSQDEPTDLVYLDQNTHELKLSGNVSSTLPIKLSGAIDHTFDVPLVRPVTLTGQVRRLDQGNLTPLPGVRVFVDRNQNHVFDSFEPNTITLPDDPQTIANETGTYSLSVLPGDLVLRVEPPTGDDVTTPAQTEYSLTTQSGQSLGHLDFTVAAPSTDESPSVPQDVDTQHANTVPEGAIPGSRVGITLQATDPQGDDVFYRLTDDAGGRFAIDPLTGVVTVKEGRLLNASIAPSHTIKAEAVDAAGHTSAEASFVVRVTPVPANALPIASILPARVSVVEGDSGPNFVSFLVKLNKPSDKIVTVDFSTFTGNDPHFTRPEGISADTPFASDNPDGGDFLKSSGRLTFAPNVTEQIVRVQIVPDTRPESNELFFVQLRSPVNARLSTEQAVATAEILDDDSAPQLVVSDTRMLEGDAAGQNDLVFTVQLIGKIPLDGNGQPVVTTVDYQTGNVAIDTAVAGTDYTATSGTLTFTDSSRVQVVHVPILGNTTDESDKTVSLKFVNPVNLGLSRPQVVGTILNDDSPNVMLSLTPTLNKIREGNSGSQQVEFVATLVGKPSGSVTVNYATTNGTATAGSDYAAASGSLTFALGEIQKSIFVTVFGDTTVEPDETFSVALSLPAQPHIAIDPDHAVGKVVIRNDDQAILTEDGDLLTSQLTTDLTGIFNAGGGTKNNPALVAEMQVQALQIVQSQGLTKAIIIILDPVDFVLSDPNNRQSGYTGSTGSVNQIPGTYYSGNGTVELLIVPVPPDGTYNVQLAGLGGDFNASITVVNGNETTTTTVSQSLADGATLNVAVQVGNTNTSIPVGLGLAAANSGNAAVGVVGAFGRPALGLALAQTFEEFNLDNLDLDRPNVTAMDQLFTLLTVARNARQRVFEQLWQSLGNPFSDLLGNGLNVQNKLPAEMLDRFWMQLGQTLIGVPSGIYRLSDMLESLVPKSTPQPNKSAQPRSGEQGQLNNAPGNNDVKAKRSAIERPRSTPIVPPSGNGNGQSQPPTKPDAKKGKSAQVSEPNKADRQQTRVPPQKLR